MRSPTLAAVVAGAICIASAISVACGQSYPIKPIRIILAFSSGGTDLVGRFMALKLSTVLGQQVVPDPRVGASGNIAHEAAAKSPPDGYTLLMAGAALVMNPNLNPKVRYDPLRDFAPVSLIATIPNVLVVHPSVPAKSLRELVELARSQPGKLAYASGGVGSGPHLAAEMLKSATKTQILHVPYKGGASVGLIGAMSGEVDIVIAVASSVAPYVKNGRMRALAVFDTKRVDSLPQVPTSAEAGIPELIAVNWYMLVAPAGTPRAIISQLNAEAVKITQSAETRERLAAVGAEPAFSTPEQTADFLRADYERWGRVIRDAGITAE
jgi:tripartite-type tricarboxylate transporter receptor subunit TctC